MSQTDAIDQSNNNATLSPFDGLSCYAHKMSEGHTFYDAFAKPRLGAALNAGLPLVCAYHVLRATGSSGTQQAQWFLHCCDLAGFDVTRVGNFVMNDWEGWSDGFADAATAYQFADYVNNAAGRETVIVYGGLPNPNIHGFSNIWLADYRSQARAMTSPLWPVAAVWQWGNRAPGGGDTSQILDRSWLDHLAGIGHLNPEENVTNDDLNAIAHKLATDAEFTGAMAATVNGTTINLCRGPEYQGIHAGIVKANVPTADQIAAAILAKLPPGGPSLDAMTAAFKGVMSNTSLTIDFQTP